MTATQPEHAMPSSSPEEASSSATSFTFVNNDPSQTTSSPDGAQSHDRFAHTRAKRKRTSPQDFAVLERAYEENPKPDKAARIALTADVAMTEKGVQIWFQNRRQMTKRKKDMWQGNEITNIIESVPKQKAESMSPPATQEMTTQESPVSSQTSVGDISEERVGGRPGQGIFANASMSSFEYTSRGEQHVKSLVDTCIETITSSSSKADAVQDTVDVEDGDAARTLPAGVEVVDTQAVPTRMDGQSSLPQKSSRTLKRSDSKMRLRMSLDGKAELILDRNSPSPPSKANRRESWPARGPLQRSQSAINPSIPSLSQTASDLRSSSQTSSSQPWVRTRAVGLSRDARTWEFYCDPDARDALTIAAEHDRKGMAQGALGLLRSNSGSAKHKLPGSPLTPNIRKQNTLARKGVHSEMVKTAGKRKSLDDLGGERPKLARTSSSVARLQTTGLMPPQGPKAAPMLAPKFLTKKSGQKKGAPVEIFEDAEDDSDKENWQPGTRVSAPTHPQRAYPDAPSRQILGTNLREISHEASIGALLSSKNLPNVRRKQKLARANSHHAGQENGADAGVDEEVADFMGERTVMAQGEELNAVQNLLSLKQGGRW